MSPRRRGVTRKMPNGADDTTAAFITYKIPDFASTTPELAPRSRI